jgi:5-methylcytosine-specific restriction endonuclease McrA
MKPRSGEWRTIRNHHLEKEPACQVCGGKKKLNVHHCIPFHIDPKKELDDTNLITLCEYNHCHVVFGHLGDYHSYNKDVREDVAIWAKKIQNRP